MAPESLTAAQAELFSTYRQPNRRHIFLEVIERFIGSHTCERSELADAYKACMKRRADKNLTKRIASGPIVSDLSQFNAGGPVELFDRDWKEHGEFRGL